ncbi:Replication factor C large subunit [Euphorbia peplus]|nr:Replication factor C large subunit [Euphorbia peplus]
MDMDMDMDMPLPDELELLEANYTFHEDHFDPPSPEPEDRRQSPPQSPSHPSDSQFIGHKRPLPHASDSPNREDLLVFDEKRSKVDTVAAETDEDWLRRSPSPEKEEVVVLEKEETMVYRYASKIDGDFIPVTAPSGGDIVYAKISGVESEERSRLSGFKSRSHCLISDPVDVLLQRLEAEAFTKALQASSESQTDVVHTETERVHEKLWVEKYAPSSFSELLSDEHTNREVLLWLKQWDSCVFGSEIRSTSDEVFSALRRHSSGAQNQSHAAESTFTRRKQGHGWNNRNFRHSNNLDHGNTNLKEIKDLWSKKTRPTGPPEHKILLLCGPPGLGKTTLAHVAAKHCGYRVVEVNASDDRSSSIIEAKILDVVQMNSVMADSKPKCLVIDEIDGSLGDGKGAVEVILKMVSAERKSTTGKENVTKGEETGKPSSKKGRKKTASLSRPVICICNDLYAPALRPLRQIAKVHIFVQPTVSRVVNRLKYICNKEGMKTSSIALTALAECTECDIMSCLNTLQFLNKKNERLNTLEIDSQVVGQKDMSKSFFDIWKEIFQKRRIKQDRRSRNGSLSSEFNFLYSLISGRGDYDVIFDGIHENILQLHYHDPLMQKTLKCLNTLGISDITHQYIMRTQQMPLYAYQPPLAIVVHNLVAQVEKPNIEWPKSYQRYRSTLMDKIDVLKSWQNKIPPNISRHLSTKSLVEDSISPLLHILSPTTLKPVALHLLSQKQKHDLAQLVSAMVSYSVTYRNIKTDPLSSRQEPETASDISTLSFDPPICGLIRFKGYNSGHYVLPLAVKQVLIHEVEKQKILQVSRSVHLTDGCNEEDLDLADNDNASLSADKTLTRKDVRNPKQCNPRSLMVPSNSDSSRSALSNIKPKSQENPKKPSTGPSSFFDRFRKASSKGSQSSASAVHTVATSERDSRPVLFKYNEGYTNAVKRPVRMRDFLI